MYQTLIIFCNRTEKTIARYSSAVATKEVIGTFHVRGKDKQDRTRYLDLSASLIQWENKSAILCFVRDVTEQVQTRELLIQSEKMLSVGGLAAGMAHEINNPLAGMVQSAQVVVNRLAPGLLANDKTALDAGTTMDAIKVYAEKRGILRLLDNMLLAGKNAAEIVDNMLSFAQKPGLEKQSWDLSAVLDKTLRLVRTDFTLKDGYDFKKINIRKQVEPGVKKALCEESKIRQVLLNLFKNAAQAMAEEEENKSPEINVCIFQKEERCCISVEDNGPGMEETVRKRIFEPFYSTKETSAGTGLGLSVSYFIVTEDHEGQMDVVSTPGQGTKFTICLPADQEKA
ncbi:MAG: HAMP domain-containing histidine kinase [Desulfobacter sp.]|nr:MAG: HAMP domain-containing histidine kinase [Desulfobacter sp.]